MNILARAVRAPVSFWFCSLVLGLTFLAAPLHADPSLLGLQFNDRADSNAEIFRLRHGNFVGSTYIGYGITPSFQFNLHDAGTLAADLDFSANIYEPNGELGVTLWLMGSAGSAFLTISFSSDNAGDVLSPISRANTVTYYSAGDWQPVTDFFTQDGDNGPLQNMHVEIFVDSHIPDHASTLALIGAALGVMLLGGRWARR